MFNSLLIIIRGVHMIENYLQHEIRGELFLRAYKNLFSLSLSLHSIDRSIDRGFGMCVVIARAEQPLENQIITHTQRDRQTHNTADYKIYLDLFLSIFFFKQKKWKKQKKHKLLLIFIAAFFVWVLVLFFVFNNLIYDAVNVQCTFCTVQTAYFIGEN